MNTASKASNPVIHLNAVRLSFPDLWVPKIAGEGGKLKYGATFMLDKKIHAKEITALNEAVQWVKVNSKKLAGNTRPMKNPVREGSEKTHLDGYTAQNRFITARNDSRPGVVDRNLSPLVAEDGKPYAGCYVNATVECYGYLHPKSGPGITFSLRNVQFVRDGEPFGEKRTKAEEDFTALEGSDDTPVDQTAGAGSSTI
jgi:hypothetical protein